MMVNMIQTDMIWHTEHHNQAIRELVFLQQQLFNQRIERYRQYGKSPNNKSDMGQERTTNEELHNMVNLERYHVMTESEIIQILYSENLNSSRQRKTSDHAMMAWENFEEPINTNKIDENDNLFEDEEHRNKNSIEDEEADDEYSEHLVS